MYKGNARLKARGEKSPEMFISFVSELATLEEDDGLDQRTASKTFVHYEVKGREIGLSSAHTTHHVCDAGAVVSKIYKDRARLDNM